MQSSGFQPFARNSVRDASISIEIRSSKSRAMPINVLAGGSAPSSHASRTVLNVASFLLVRSVMYTVI